ncbi:MAG: plasmid recombination protein [Prevotella sp.]|nr:plasmid recombination protein [Prevotella sp.]
MAGQKQVMDLRSNAEGITTLESNEQQRNWTQEHALKKVKDPLSNYDQTRFHLNFEVVKGGIVQPIDTTKTIAQKLAENLAARGIKDPNARPNVKRKRRTLAQFIFSGNRERMLELAFGNQVVDLSKGADNSHLTRQKNIEEWAKDVYGFVAKHFGEDNIISFYVHLDEKSPHIHCSVVPVNEQNKISWHSIFGKDIEECSAKFNSLHDSLEQEVNSKWGLERGSNMAETKARHRSTEEYKRDLVSQIRELETTREGLLRQIHRAEIKLKGITTMIANLQERKEKVQEQIDLIAKQFGQEGADNADLAKQMQELRKELEGIDDKLALRNKMLEDANNTIAAAKARLAELQERHDRMQNVLGDDMEKEATILQKNIISTYHRMYAAALEPVLSTHTQSQQNLLEKSGFNDLAENSGHVVNVAMLLALRYVHEATNYAESCGGGGSHPSSGWGKDKDEDDEHWWRRCIAQAAAMVRPAARKRKRGR